MLLVPMWQKAYPTVATAGQIRALMLILGTVNLTQAIAIVLLVVTRR